MLGMAHITHLGVPCLIGVLWDEVDMNSEWIEKWIEAVAVSTAPCGLPINGVNVAHVAEQREANGRYVCGIPL